MQDYRMDTFLAVCRFMNFTRAAAELGLTQPAVSQHIHYLENEYGVKLFQMDGKKLYLTEAGQMLKSAALTLKHDELYLKTELRRTAEKEKEYFFGATLTVADYILGPGLAQFLEKHSQSRISLYVGNTRELLDKIDSGELDFAIVEGYFRKEDYESYLYRNEKYIPVCARGRAGRYEGAAVEDLLGETLILREEGSGTRKILEKILEEHNLSVGDFKKVLEIGSLAVIKELVSRGCGITFLYEAAAAKELESGALERFRPARWDYSHNMAFIHRKGSIFKEEYKKIYEEIKNGRG